MRKIIGLLVVGVLTVLIANPILAKDKAPVSRDVKKEFDQKKPFGFSLFQGQFAADRQIGLNPQYRIMPGDELVVSMWGTVNFHKTVTVDKQGNIFLPKVGPIPVQGVMYSNLTKHVKAYLTKYYKDNVNLYINLQGTQPVSVYVTGEVESPGRYSGESNYSVLHYIDMAQGISPLTGSFREIEIIRDGRVIAKIDLYKFLLTGELAKIQLREGDTIFVHRQNSRVYVNGAVKNSYFFEFKTSPIRGENLVEFCNPLPEATHVLLEGTRENAPFSSYMSISEFKEYVLKNGDKVTFQEGVPEERLLVNIKGQHKGPQSMILPENATLLQVLRQIPVDPQLANTDAVFLRRKSVARKQKESLDESLRRLQSSVLQTGTVTEEASKIQSKKIQMVQEFVSKAKKVEPEGRMVVNTDKGLKDVLLQDNDEIIIPRKTELVHVNGEVLMPRAVVYQPGQTVDYYIDRAGGLTQRADEDRIVIIRADGEAVVDNSAEVYSGDEIMVLPQVPSNLLQVSKSIADILYKIAITASVPLRF